MSQATILNNQVHWVDTALVSPNPYQPRIEFNDATIVELSDSIRQYGILQPLTVTQIETPTPDGGMSVHYELIAGERRLRASKMAGLQKVPVIIRVGDSNKERLELAIIENLQREDLNAVDRAKAFLQLAQEHNLSHTEIGKRMGKSREYVSNTLRVLALPQYILDGLIARKISEGHTRPLLMLADKPDSQRNLFHDIVNYKMSVRAAEARARKESQDKVRKEHLKVDPKLLNLEEKLSNSLRARVAVETAQDGNSGRLVINFGNPEELNELIRMMGQVTGDMSLQDVQMAAPKTNMLSEEQKIETPSGFALNTGFLNDVSVDDDKGAILTREETPTNDPVRFGFNPNPLEMVDLGEQTIAREREDARASGSITASFDSQPVQMSSIESAPAELGAPSHSNESPASKNDDFVPLSELLSMARAKQSPLDSGSIEAYESENDASNLGEQDSVDTDLPIQEHDGQAESSGITDAELDRSFKPATVASSVTPDLYSALFNI